MPPRTCLHSIVRTLQLIAAIFGLCFLQGNIAAGQDRKLGSKSEKAGEWQSLFDGESLRRWQNTPFSGRGEVRVEKGTIALGAGKPLTGVTWTESFPRVDYEIRFEGVRLGGNDFFATVTFPIEDSFCTLVTGGWGGDIVGLSSIDGWDAADNETRTYFNFETGRWYRFHVQVTAGRIRVWIDEKPVINVEITGRSISLRRGEIKLSAPLGFASYATAGALRRIEYRLLNTPARSGNN
jgi:hypothetical protein